MAERPKPKGAQAFTVQIGEGVELNKEQRKELREALSLAAIKTLRKEGISPAAARVTASYEVWTSECIEDGVEERKKFRVRPLGEYKLCTKVNLGP